MTNKITDLPTDNYPVSDDEKNLTERFFTPIQADKKDDKFKPILIAAGLLLLTSIPTIDDFFKTKFGDNTMVFKIAFVIFGTYFLLKINIIKI